MTLPNPTALTALLHQLGATPEDAAEVLRTMPAPERDPELWRLLERSHHLLSRGLANQSDNAEPLPPSPAALKLFPVHVILATVDAIRACHQQFGIPDDVSWETLSQLGRAMAAHRQSHGQPGIHLSRWDWLRFFGWLYQVGRLEVTPYRIRTHPPEAGPLFWYDDETASRLGPGFRKGDPALGLHVPATDALTPEACDESLRRIQTAFAGVYPGDPPRIATCTSWLLDDQLAEYLPADSNILTFQRRFELVPGARDNDEAILHFVFGADRPKQLEALPQDTTLERAVVRHLQTGRHWRTRTGWLTLGDIAHRSRCGADTRVCRVETHLDALALDECAETRSLGMEKRCPPIESARRLI
jgi:hypothetical protein